MNKNIKQLLVYMLDQYSDILGNNGCNDWDWPSYFTEQDKIELTSFLANELEPQDLQNPADFIVVDCLKDWVLKQF